MRCNVFGYRHRLSQNPHPIFLLQKTLQRKQSKNRKFNNVWLIAAIATHTTQANKIVFEQEDDVKEHDPHTRTSNTLMLLE